ncbi:hypothetical protein [Staphylococcus hominis]|uniref:hypothetical protein n=1 Tax=Staphylococcus hominis TaxID=1290 RepID=UPI002DB977E4|nr:hypothetical protein [Staphylococcus hominis]MEB5793927.1 ORF6C domain-containing protein [Staphylococcus hominis]
MSKNLIDISKRQADQLVQQAQLSREIINKIEEHEKKMEAQDRRMIDFESKMIDTENRLNKRMEDVEKKYVLTHGEGKFIKSKIAERSYHLANNFFKERVSKELYLKKRIHLIQGIHGVLNRHFNTITYTTIKHVEYKEAMDFISNLELADLPIHFLKLTDKQIATAEKYGDFEILKRLG